MKYVIATTLMLATPVAATPMWEQADRWVCALERHIRVPGGDPVVEMDPNGLSFDIDFQAGTLSSAFVSGAVPIIDRASYDTDGAVYNILIAAWDSGNYPTIIQEYDGKFWEIAGSGALEQDDEVWIAMYRCAPDLPDS